MPRIGFLEGFVSQSKRVGEIPSQIVEEAIGIASQCKKNLACAVAFQVEGDAFLIAVEALKKMAVIGT